MDPRFSFKSYQRPFAQPLRTAHGEWSVREGFIVRVETELGVGYGEVAPIPEFGTETVAQAQAFLEQLVASPELANEAAALAAVPCCAFGLSASATVTPAPMRAYRVAALLPAGQAALPALVAKLGRGYQTFKWKIGVLPMVQEQACFRELANTLPAGARLRLDANGGLSIEALESWLAFLQSYSEVVEYFEQPLSVGQEAEMARLLEASCVPIALDESLNGIAGARWLSEWSGPLVVKPALMGDVSSLVRRLAPVAERVTLSSVFETAVGLGNALHLADQLPALKGAIGFDTVAACTDGLTCLEAAPVIGVNERAQLIPETIWHQLPHLT